MAKRQRQRKSTQNSGEDYYEILDVSVNAEPEEIKDSYLRLVKLFTPESHAAEFEQIRRAYETLRDRQKRSQYDLIRKYGSSGEELVDRAYQLLQENKLKQAEQVLRKAKKIDPHYLGIYLTLAAIALHGENDRQFRAEIDGALAHSHTDEARVSIHIAASRILVEEERVEQAVAELDGAVAQYPALRDAIQRIKLDILREFERFDEALEVVNGYLRDLQRDTPDALFWFIARVGLMVEMERWQDWSQIQTRVRRFFRCLATEEDRQSAFSELVEEHDVFAAGRYTKGALAFLDLALYLKPKDKTLLPLRRKLEERLHFERELDRLLADRHVIPLVTLQAVKWSAADSEDDSLQELLDEMETDLATMLDEESQFHEEIAAGILHLRRHYPTMYKRFETAWNELYESHVGHLNRETRRSLR